MKKNKAMRSASVLLVATLLTTSVISGTLAKYTTQDAAEDTARVAKWGVELQAIGNLYGDTYKDRIVTENDTNATVQSVDRTADVVAPGTQNAEGFTFSLKGKPEVDGTITTTITSQNIFLKAGTYGIMIPVDSEVVTAANFDELSGLYTKSGNSYSAATAYAASTKYYTLEDYVEVSANYYPVVYNLAGNTSYTGTTTEDSLNLAAAELARQLGIGPGTTDSSMITTYTGTKTFATNEDLANLKVDGETITWAWGYGDATKVGDTAAESDKADTILGLLKNTTEGEVVKFSGTSYGPLTEYTDYCLDTQFSIDITVTQAD